MSNLIGERISKVRDQIRLAEQAAGRASGSVRLVAVSKTRPATDVRQAQAAGQLDFGENYVQEALAKQDELQDLPDLIWHFIGPIQSNKTRSIASRFAWVHSVDQLRHAQRLSEQRPETLPPLNVCLQVNISGEPSKSGVTLEQLPGLAAAVAELPNLRLRGLMAIPAPGSDPAGQRIPFAQLRNALEQLELAGLDTLSMGMSDDLQAAIMEGATHVRIGTALFGPRSGQATIINRIMNHKS